MNHPDNLSNPKLDSSVLQDKSIDSTLPSETDHKASLQEVSSQDVISRNGVGRWLKNLLVALTLIALVTFGVYLNSLNNGFHYDDQATIQENEAIRSLKNIPSFFTSVQPFSSDKIFAAPKHYRPILLTTYALNYAWGDLNPPAYHLTNIVIHILVAFLIYFVILSMVENHVAAILGGLLFGVHPLFTETLNYISARSSLLCTLFYVGSFYFLMRFRILQASQDSKGAIGRYVSFLLTFVLAFLSKEIALTLPVMILVYDLYTFRLGSKRRILAFAWPYLPGLAVATAYVYFAHGKLYALMWGIFQGKGLRDMGTQLFTQANVTVQYLLLFLWPTGLTPDHLVTESRSLGEVSVLISLGVIGVLVSIILLLVRTASSEGKAVSLGICWFLLTSLPTILIPLNIVMQEHRAYLPAVGLIMAAGAAFGWLYERSKRWPFVLPYSGYSLKGSFFIIIFFFLILSGFSMQTVKRNAVWKDDLTLWSDAVFESASGFRAHNNLGAAYEARGRLELAIREYERAIAIEPGHFITYYNLGLAYSKQGKMDLAVVNFKKSLKINPIFPLAHHGLGMAYATINEPHLAEAELREALSLDPSHLPSRRALALLYLSMENFDQAQQVFLEVLRVQPDSLQDHMGLAIVYNQQHQFDKAISEYEEVLRLDPRNIEAYHSLGLIFYELEKIDMAITAYEKAISIAPQDIRLYTNLGNAYKRLGRSEEAIKAYSEAVRLNPTYPLGHYNMATTYEQLGRKTKALEHYARFLDFAASNLKYEKMVRFAQDRQKKLLALGPKPKG